MICVVGEILFDLFPSYSRVGGAPFNFAFHLKNFGFPVRFISRVGKDSHGKKLLDLLEKHRFNLDDIQIDPAHPTGTVKVKPDKSGGHQFEIIPDVAYDYISFEPDVHGKLMRQADLVYFGTLAQRSKHGFENIQKIVQEKTSSASGFYDINLRPDCYHKELIFQSLVQADTVKLNQEELMELKKMMAFQKNSHTFVHHLLERCGLKVISLTKGFSGSELYTREGHFKIDGNKPVRFVDSVGAGDAYAAMLAAGLIKDMQPGDIIQMASSFATSICEIKGALPEAAFYKPFQEIFFKGE